MFRNIPRVAIHQIPYFYPITDWRKRFNRRLIFKSQHTCYLFELVPENCGWDSIM